MISIVVEFSDKMSGSSYWFP